METDALATRAEDSLKLDSKVSRKTWGSDLKVLWRPEDVTLVHNNTNTRGFNQDSRFHLGPRSSVCLVQEGTWPDCQDRLYVKTQ